MSGEASNEGDKVGYRRPPVQSRFQTVGPATLAAGGSPQFRRGRQARSRNPGHNKRQGEGEAGFDPGSAHSASARASAQGGSAGAWESSRSGEDAQ